MNDRRFDPAKADKLEDPQRTHWLPPGAVMARMEVEPGWTVADIGAGTGYFARPLARAVGDEGRVVAIDAQQDMLARLIVTLAEAGGPEWIAPVLAEADALPLADDACDGALLAHVWHELDDRVGVVREVRRIVRPGGRVAVLGWQIVEPPPGPPLDHRTGPDSARDALATAGWVPSAPSRVGPYAWLVVAD